MENRKEVEQLRTINGVVLVNLLGHVVRMTEREFKDFRREYQEVRKEMTD